MDRNWLDIIPSIPLALAVPVINSQACGGTGARWVTCRSEHLEPNPRLRVNLDDPQGFSYALRYLCATVEGQLALAKAFKCRPGPDLGELLIRLAYPRTDVRDEHITDADRLALAQAIADLG